MNLIELQQYAVHLDGHVKKMTQAERKTLHNEISSVVTSLKTRGLAVPSRLREVNQDFKDEALEEMFDNVPV